jgi:AbrB family looped-hinge helix DNA binding protein
MPTATVTSKGQLTLPKRVREVLKVDAGDVVDFVLEPDGSVTVRAGRYDVADLQGILKKPARKPVSIAAMDQAIARARAR